MRCCVIIVAALPRILLTNRSAYLQPSQTKISY